MYETSDTGSDGRFLTINVPEHPAARTGLLFFRQVVNDLLTRKVRRQTATARADTTYIQGCQA